MGISEINLTKKKKKPRNVRASQASKIQQKKMDISVKENAKSKRFLIQNIQEIWDTMKTPNLRIIGIEEGKESQLKGPGKYFQQNQRRKLP